MVFNEVLPEALALMNDVFANYVIQKVACFFPLIASYCC